MKVKDIRELTEAEIVARIKDDREMLQKLRFNHAISAIENPAKIREMKRDIARFFTVLKERQAKK